MPTGAQFFEQCLSHRGASYSAAGDRFGPTRFDCSGMIHASLKELGVNDADGAVAGGAGGFTSLTYQDWITRAVALRIVPPGDLSVARTTPGMIVCLGHQTGPEGHIAVTGGANNVVETPSAEGFAVGVSAFDRNRYDFAGYVPGLVYPWGDRVTPGAIGGLARDAGCGSCLVVALVLSGLGALGAGELAHFTHLAHLL